MSIASCIKTLTFSCTFINLYIESHDGDCKNFAIELKAVVVSVGYRLLPEHKFPAPLEDCFTALKYLMKNAARWNIDPSRIAVAGCFRLTCNLISNDLT